MQFHKLASALGYMRSPPRAERPSGVAPRDGDGDGDSDDGDGDGDDSDGDDAADQPRRSTRASTSTPSDRLAQQIDAGKHLDAGDRSYRRQRERSWGVSTRRGAPRGAGASAAGRQCTERRAPSWQPRGGTPATNGGR